MTLEYKVEIPGALLKAVAQAVNQVTKTVVKFYFSDDGILIRAADEQRVNSIAIRIERGALTCFVTKKAEIVVDINKFRSLVEHLMNASVAMSIQSWDEFPGAMGKTGKNLFLELKQDSTAIYFVNRITGAYDPGDSNLEREPARGFTTLKGAELAYAIRTIHDTGFNTKLYIDPQKKELHMLSERASDSTELVECIFRDPRHKVRADGEVSVTLSTQYLYALVPTLLGVGDVSFIIRQDFPLELRFELENYNNCKVRYVLAPRIETEG